MLMSEKGIAATSVREITDAADANVAAVNYYFGSKTELLYELLKVRFGQLDRALLEKVLAVEEAAQGKAPSVDELSSAYFDTLNEQAFNQKTGQLHPFVLLIERASSEQETVLARAQDLSLPGITRLKDLLAAAIKLEDTDKLNFPVLLDLMFSTSITAISSKSTNEEHPNLLPAIREFLIGGVERYMARIVLK